MVVCCLFVGFACIDTYIHVYTLALVCLFVLCFSVHLLQASSRLRNVLSFAEGSICLIRALGVAGQTSIAVMASPGLRVGFLFRAELPRRSQFEELPNRLNSRMPHSHHLQSLGFRAEPRFPHKAPRPKQALFLSLVLTSCKVQEYDSPTASQAHSDVGPPVAAGPFVELLAHTLANTVSAIVHPDSSLGIRLSTRCLLTTRCPQIQ